MTWVIQLFNRDGYYAHVSASSEHEAKERASQRAQKVALIATSIPFQAGRSARGYLDITLPENFKDALGTVNKVCES